MQTAEVIIAKYDLGKLDEYYKNRLKVNNGSNRKKKSKLEKKIDFRNMFEYTLWSFIMTFIGYQFYKGYNTTNINGIEYRNHVREGFADIMKGNCLPTYFSDPNRMKYNFTNSVGEALSDAGCINPICLAFHNSLDIIFGSLTSNKWLLLPGLVSKLLFPVTLKKLITYTTGLVLKCFENPFYVDNIKYTSILDKTKSKTLSKSKSKSKSKTRSKSKSYQEKESGLYNDQEKESGLYNEPSETKVNRKSSAKSSEIKFKVIPFDTDELIQILPGGTPMTGKQFVKKLHKLGLYEMYMDAINKLNDLNSSKSCSVDDKKMMHGGELFTLASLLSYKVLLICTAAAGGATTYFNWDLWTRVAKNTDLMCNSALAQPEMKVTNFVFNIFGLGVNCLNNSVWQTVGARLFTGQNLFHVFTLFNTLIPAKFSSGVSGFVGYASEFFTSFKVW
jgi:hypothetical protein